MAEASCKRFLNHLKDFAKSTDYSDLTITCLGDEHKVHKVIVCSQVEFLKTAIKFPGKESENGKIDLPEDDPAIVKLLIRYLYEADYPARVEDASNLKENKKATGKVQGPRTPHSCIPSQGRYHVCLKHDGEYVKVCSHHQCDSACHCNCANSLCATCDAGDGSQLLTHAKMYEIGEKYNVSGLKELSMEKFRSACDIYWNHPRFPIAAHHAFSTTPEGDRGLRDIVSNTIACHMVLLKKYAVKALMTEFNGLAMDLLYLKAENHCWDL